MKWLFFLVLLFISLLLESTVTNLPLVLIVLFCGAVVLRNSGIFFWSFAAGLFLDALTLRTLGQSSLFFLVFLAGTCLYERKFEIQSVPFVLIFSFIGSFSYIWLFGGSAVFFQSLQSCVICGVLFFVWLKGKRFLA